jgi:hypothetical protein
MVALCFLFKDFAGKSSREQLEMQAGDAACVVEL